MTRYRPSSSVPGPKRPWLIESDPVSHPLDGGCAPLAGEVRRVPSTGGGPGERRVASSDAATVDPAGAPAARSGRGGVEAGVPQDGQNRAAAGTDAPQKTQGTGGFYAGSAP